MDNYLEALSTSQITRICWLDISMFDPDKILCEHDRVLVYTPSDDMSIRYRIISAPLVKKLTEATRWAFLSEP